MPFPVVFIVAALDIRVICQRTGQEGLHRCICAALHAAEQADICFRQRSLRTTADAAADQRIHALRGQKACERTMTAAVGVHNLR